MPGRKPKHFEEAEILTAIRNSGGVISYVAARLGCCWDTARKNIQRFDSTQDALAEEDSKTHALVAQKYIQAVDAGERWAIERALDTKMRREGYGMVQRYDHTSDGEKIDGIQVEFVTAPAPAPASDKTEKAEPTKKERPAR